MSFAARFGSSRTGMSPDEQKAKNRRLAWILASVAFAIFAGYILKVVVFRG